MSKRFPRLVASYLFTASLALFGQGQGASDVIELPGQGSAQSRVVGYGAYPPQPQIDPVGFTKFLDTNVAAGTSQLIPLPDGSKFYVVSTAGIQAWNGTLTSLLHNITGVSGTVQTASVSPDGKYLVVMTNHLYLIDTTADAILATDPGFAGMPTSFVISHDSKIVWILFNGIGSGLVTVSLTTHASTGLSFNPQYPVSSLAQSPKGLLYITFPGGQVDEIDPTTLTLTAAGLIPLTGTTPGPLSFTPDGTTAYFVNQQPTADQGSLLKLNLTTHSVTSWPTSGPTPTFSQVIIAGNSKIFAYSPADTTLWDVTPSPLSAKQSTVTMAYPTNHVLSVAVSDEVPSARFLFAQVDDIVRRDLYRIDLSNGNLNALASFSLDPAVLEFVGTPAQSGATGFTQLNAIQVVNQGATSLPLIARVLNNIARPVANQIVSFTVDPASGIVLTNPSQVTGSDGWVQTTLVAPSTAGTYTVTLTAGVVSTTFTIVVPGPGGGQSLSVYGGNGQLLPELAATSLTSPLAVIAQDILGNPLSGIDVTFTVSDGPGHMESADVITDENGIATDRFDSGLLSTLMSGLAFQTSTINASSSAGSTTLVATTFHQNLDGTGQPIVTVVTPDSLQLTIGQGDVLAGGITTSTIGNNGFQVGKGIPNVGLRMGAWPDATMNGPLSCKGSSLSDNLGMSMCNVQAACQMGSFDTTLAIGEFRAFRVTATITSGHPQALTLISGNNQTGHPGDLSVPVVAKLTDGCNQPIAGTLVVWSITQGSGTLTQVQSLSAADGTVSARVTLGQVVGPITVQASLAGLPPVVFQLSDVAVISGISVVSGASQSVQVGQVFANPVIFVVRDTSNNPVQGVPVVFTVTGTSSVNPLSAITDVQGRVQTSVTAGNAAGPVIVTATITNFTVMAILTVRPPGPQVSVNSFVNAGSYVGGLTPCGLVAAFGAGLAPNIPGVVLLGNPLAPLGPWPFTLNQLTITVNGINAPIQAVANVNGDEQVNFQVPCEVSVGPATVVVTYNGSSTTVTGVPLTAAQPGIFAFRGTNGSFYAGAIRALDGTYVTQTNFAHRGETYYLVLTGLGQTNPIAITNTLGVANQNVIATVAMVINIGGVNTGIQTVSARYLQGAAGVYVVGFTIPPGFGTGTDLPIDISAFVNGQNVFGGSHLLLPGIN